MIGVAITKEVTWRGHAEQFSNVYHYDTSTAFIGEALGKAIVDAVVALEKPVHATTVKFVKARVWTAGGSPSENVTVGIWDLTGTGTQTENANMDREATYLVEWKTSRPSATGRPVTLKKYIHGCHTGGTTPAGLLQGTTTVPQTIRDLFTTYANGVKQLSAGGEQHYLIAPSGSGRRAETPYIFDWIEHHEFT